MSLYDGLSFISEDAKRINTAYRNGSYAREAESALRGLRDAEGFFRASNDPTDPDVLALAGTLTVARQWYEQMLKDIGTLQRDQDAMLKKMREANVMLDNGAAALNQSCDVIEKAAADLKLMAALRKRVPGWILWIFGA